MTGLPAVPTLRAWTSRGRTGAVTTSLSATVRAQIHYKDAIPLLGGHGPIAKQMIENPVGLLGSVHTTAYHLGAKCVVLGDAAHAITPFFGATRTRARPEWKGAVLVDTLVPGRSRRTVGCPR